jgi:hypothetical protein
MDLSHDRFKIGVICLCRQAKLELDLMLLIDPDIARPLEG